MKPAIELTEEELAVIERTIAAACRELGVERAALEGRGRSWALCLARYICWEVIRSRTRATLAQTGRPFDRQAADVCCGLRALAAWRETCRRVQGAWQRVAAAVG